MRYRDLFAWIALTALAGCGAEGSARQTTTALRGVVAYQGTFEGALEVSVFDAFPPRGAPVAVRRVESAVFPYTYSFDRLPPGRYFVLAMLDQNDKDGAKFHPTIDPGGAHGGFTSPVSVQVQAGGSAKGVDVQLVDPSSSSPWIRRNYR